jgi:predicted site-specific integrase-resolvase
MSTRVTIEPATPDPLCPRDVARICHVNSGTVARWAKSGRLPFTLTPTGHRRYAVADVEALLNRRNAS